MQNRLRVGRDIAQRLMKLAVRTLRVAATLRKDVVGRHVALQLIRASTSGGANYEEARGAESPQDFVHKVRVALKELHETMYWLGLIKEAGLVKGSLDSVLDETAEMAAILAASARTARKKHL